MRIDFNFNGGQIMVAMIDDRVDEAKPMYVISSTGRFRFYLLLNIAF